jgi:hypothetical protein
LYFDHVAAFLQNLEITIATGTQRVISLRRIRVLGKFFHGLIARHVTQKLI